MMDRDREYTYKSHKHSIQMALPLSIRYPQYQPSTILSGNRDITAPLSSSLCPFIGQSSSPCTSILSPAKRRKEDTNLNPPPNPRPHRGPQQQSCGGENEDEDYGFVFAGIAFCRSRPLACGYWVMDIYGEGDEGMKGKRAG